MITFDNPRAVADPFTGPAVSLSYAPQGTGRDGRALTEADTLAALSDPAHPNFHRALATLNRFSGQLTDRMLRLSTPGSFPAPGTSSIVTIGGQENVDMRFAALFTVEDYRTQRDNLAFQIENTINAVTFRPYKVGERIEMQTVKAEGEWFTGEVVGGGLQWTQLWARHGRRAFDRARLTNMMYVGYNRQMQAASIAVLTASGGIAVSYQTGATTAEKDVNTINAGITAIKAALYNADGADGNKAKELINGRFYLLYNDLTAGYGQRAARALRAQITDPENADAIGFVEEPVTPMGHPDVPTGAWYLVLSGGANVLAIFDDLRLFSLEDARVAGVAEGEVGQGIYKAVRGRATQVATLALS